MRISGTLPPVPYNANPPPPSNQRPLHIASRESALLVGLPSVLSGRPGAPGNLPDLVIALKPIDCTVMASHSGPEAGIDNLRACAPGGNRGHHMMWSLRLAMMSNDHHEPVYMTTEYMSSSQQRSLTTNRGRAYPLLWPFHPDHVCLLHEPDHSPCGPPEESRYTLFAQLRIACLRPLLNEIIFSGSFSTFASVLCLMLSQT